MIRQYYALSTIDFWPAYLIHMRPYLWFVSGFAGMAGVFLVFNNADSRFYLSLLPFFLSYGFGQALTDCFQIDTDKISSQYRPLSKGIIRMRDVFRVSLGGLLLCGLILVYLQQFNAILVLISITGLGAYSHVKKKYWPWGPPLNSMVVSLLPVMGYLSFMGTNTIEWWVVLPVALVIFLAYNIFVLMGYLKDIGADRAAGYKTFTVVWGWEATVLVCDIIYLMAFLLIVFFGWLDKTSWIFYVLALICAATGQLKAHFQKVKEEQFAFIPIIQSVRSFLFICFTIINHHFAEAFWVWILAYLLFEVVLYFRPEKEQI